MCGALEFTNYDNRDTFAHQTPERARAEQMFVCLGAVICLGAAVCLGAAICSPALPALRAALRERAGVREVLPVPNVALAGISSVHYIDHTRTYGLWQWHAAHMAGGNRYQSSGR